MEQREAELLKRIRQLECEVKHWKERIKKQNYGLVWLDVPEAFEAEAENAIPILEEVKDKAVAEAAADQPTHMIIEGDNYHVLTCLNYTHRGRIDVIYIDPPYNTGNDGFTYRDKRKLTEFPDGQPVPKDNPLRHSTWLSFMHKRLLLARNLLSNRGVIFISIDDNEQANLKLLCDSVFGEENFVANFIWNKTSTPPALSKKVRKTHEYILCYEKSSNSEKYVGLVNNGGDAPLLNESNKESVLEFPANYVLTNLNDGLYHAGQKDRVELLNDIYVENGIIISSFSLKGRFRWLQDTLDREISEKCLLVVKSEKFAIRYCRQGDRTVAPANFIVDRHYEFDTSIDKQSQNVDTNEKAGKDLSDIIGAGNFDFPKPTSLVQYLINFHCKQDSIILDFFAGSGTTLHATLQLNAADGGKRQCILVNNNENQICERITYERNRRVMCGYKNAKGEAVAGLGGKLRYYRTTFVGKNRARQATDSDCVALALKAGYLLAIGENTHTELISENCYQLFTDEQKHFTAVYFSGSLANFGSFAAEISKIQQDKEAAIAVYIFGWGSVESFANEFDSTQGLSLKPIPQPILKVYQSLQ